MNDLGSMDCFKGMDQTSDEKAGNLLAELSSSGNMVPQVTSEQDVHDQIQVHFVLKCKMHIDNKLTIDKWE